MVILGFAGFGWVLRGFGGFGFVGLVWWWVGFWRGLWVLGAGCVRTGLKRGFLWVFWVRVWGKLDLGGGWN